jgi:DnaJ domain
LLQLFFGLLALALLLVAAHYYVNANPARLAQGVRAFVAAFSALAGTGLLFAGRFGLALITLGATVLAVQAMRRHTGSIGSFGGSADTAGRGGRSSEVTTDTLRMQLDHATGELEGEVLRGPFAGRLLDSLGLSDLLDLLAHCQREDPRSVPLLETYLDRRHGDWRAHAGADPGTGREDGGSAPAGGMDEAMALSVLGLEPGASEEEIKAAHRRLMTKLHPDHGGSSYLAAQLNQAKDHLLRRRP